MAKVKGSFFKACESGDLVMIRNVLEENPDAYNAVATGMQAIHFAAIGNQKAAVELLLSKGADINGRNDIGQTAVSLATEYGSMDVLMSLIRHGADVDYPDSVGQSPLVRAFKKKPEVREKAVPILLAAGARYGLCEAVCKGDIDTVRAIFKNDPNALTEIKQPPEVLLRNITCGRFEGETPERAEIFKTLVAHGWQVEKKTVFEEAEGCANSGLPLLAAALHEYAQVAPETIAKPKANKDGTTTKKKTTTTSKAAKKKESSEDLCRAAASGDLTACESILAKSPTLVTKEFEGMQPIHWAAQENQAEVVEYLIGQGADVDALGGEEGRTPLHFAACEGVATTRVLVEHKADLNAIDLLGYTPLALTISEQQDESEEVVELLREAGAEYGLIEAAGMGDLERVREIFAEDPNVVAKAPSKELLMTLLLYVGNFGTISAREKILKLLFDHGLKLSPEEVQRHATSCETSNIGRFGELLRKYANTQNG